MAKAWLISANMGYGHQRAAYPLRKIAEGRIITANNDSMISDDDKRTWRHAQGFYEWVSRLHSIPVLGRFLFGIYDLVQSIPQFYPFRDLSRPTLQVYYMRRKIRDGLCASLFAYINKKDLPVVTTFFTTAIDAEHYGVKRIFCICTDSDISRAWVPADSRRTRIVYCAPTREVQERLLEYGVPASNIHLTGFPLPIENIGARAHILKHDLAKRLAVLDPDRVYLNRMRKTVEAWLGRKVRSPDRPITIMLAVGGAGAQWNLMRQAMQSLAPLVKSGRVRLYISVGTHQDLLAKAQSDIKKIGIAGTKILHSKDLFDYLGVFNQALRTTDIIWSKPSEISFYAGLGIPIIAAPPIGYQESRNLHWLQSQGIGILQEDPRYASEWLESWISDGRLAEMAFDGPAKARIDGTTEIIRLVAGK